MSPGPSSMYTVGEKMVIANQKIEWIQKQFKLFLLKLDIFFKKYFEQHSSYGTKSSSSEYKNYHSSDISDLARFVTVLININLSTKTFR